MSLTYDKALTDELLAFSEYGVTLEWLRPNSTVLELGSHTGYLTRYLIAQGHQVTGIEYDPVAAQVGRDSGLTVITGDVESAKTFETLTTPFDYIVALNILEHLRDPFTVLQNLKPHLAGDGKIIIAGPNVACWWVRRNLLFGKWEYKDAGIMDRTHLRFFTAKTWRELAEGAGYTVTRFAPTSFAMLPGERLPGRFLPEDFRRKMRVGLGKRFPTLFATVFVLELAPRQGEK